VREKAKLLYVLMENAYASSRHSDVVRAVFVLCVDWIELYPSFIRCNGIPCN